MSKIRHLLGISGGKDSAALAVYLKSKYPKLDIEYYFCDTGKELKETYKILENLEVFLGKKIERLRAAKSFPGAPFDYYHNLFNGFLPSSNARWCTRKLKLEPFEEFVGNSPVVSYVGIRGDEEREGYISIKPNIQSIFPFRKNIWSKDVIEKVLSNDNIDVLWRLFQKQLVDIKKKKEAEKIVLVETSPAFPMVDKLNELLTLNVIAFNKVVFDFLKASNYPLSSEEDFPLLDNDEILVREDIFSILEDSGVGVPGYYKSTEFEVENKKGTYARSRSGCFFCFFQQKIEWVWLFEQHLDLFKKAMEYEKSGFKWNESETLEELSKPERIKQIKEDYIKKSGNSSNNNSEYLIDILSTAEDDGCAACFL